MPPGSFLGCRGSSQWFAHCHRFDLHRNDIAALISLPVAANVRNFESPSPFASPPKKKFGFQATVTHEVYRAVVSPLGEETPHTNLPLQPILTHPLLQ